MVWVTCRRLKNPTSPSTGKNFILMQQKMPPHTRSWKARVFAATSLDGAIARRDHDVSWLTQPEPNPDHMAPSISVTRSTPSFEQHMAEVDFIVMGRRTFEVCLGFSEWPYPAKKLLVLSATSTASDYKALSSENGGAIALHLQSVRVVASPEEVDRILNEEGANMVYVDGGKTVQEFLRRGWVDEMVLTLAPVLLGGDGGRPRLFGDVPADVHFTLCGVDIIENGMVSCYYRVQGLES
ncbi:dihydrofolate reductase-like domain-containing protein [Aspergillus spinulosporus]